MTTNVFHRTNDDDDTHSKEQLGALRQNTKKFVGRERDMMEISDTEFRIYFPQHSRK